MSAYGSKADVRGTTPKSPLIANSRLNPLLKTERGFDFLGYRFGPEGLTYIITARRITSGKLLN